LYKAANCSRETNRIRACTSFLLSFISPKFQIVIDVIFRRPHPAEDFSFEVPYAHYRTSEGSVDPLAQPSSQQKYATFELDYGTSKLFCHSSRLTLDIKCCFAFELPSFQVYPFSTYSKRLA
jgi:hypothetical protein